MSLQSGLEYLKQKMEEVLENGAGHVFLGREEFEKEGLPQWSIFATNGDLSSQGMNQCELNELVSILVEGYFQVSDIRNPLLTLNQKRDEFFNLIKNLLQNDNSLGGNIFQLLVSDQDVSSQWFYGSHEEDKSIVFFSFGFFFRI